MAYKALYRTYRPTRFDEVVGQKHIIKILENAVLEGKISHAYIFSGLRGIGKTTIARIFAKAVNCEHPINGEPCNECDSCKSIINDETTDVIELDAASNNGVDQMREILEKVNFLPSSLKRKVYIIDEAHMLSTAAFNALLKTLEEPPAHVIFILATTEPYKIPATILSRCQRLDFKQLSTHEIIEMLIRVTQLEKIKITDEALQGIAEASEGGMRDALSVLDQARVYNSNQVTMEDINNITGNVSYQHLIELIKALNDQDTEVALNRVNDLLELGKDVNRILTSLIQFCRDLLLYKSLKDTTRTQYIYNKEAFMSLAHETSETRLFYYVDLFVDIQNKIRFTNSPKIYLEVGIIKIINSANLDIDILGQIQKLEEKVETIKLGGGTGYSGELVSKVNSLDNQVKKIINEVNKQDTQNFKESILSKINLLEDLSLANKAEPAKIEEQIQEINETIKELEVKFESIKTNSSIPSTETNSNSLLENKINELEQKLELMKNTSNTDSTNTDTTNYSNIETKLSELEQKIDLVQSNSTTTTDVPFDVDARITELEQKVSSMKVVPEEHNFDSTELVNKITSLQQEMIQLKEVTNQQSGENLISTSDVDVKNNVKNLNEKVEVIEEYLDMVINRVDELARNIKNSYNGITHSGSSDNDEISQLNENYISLVSLVQSLQNDFTEIEEKLSNVNSTTNIDSKIEELTNDIQNKLDTLRSDLANSIISNYTDLYDKINALPDNSFDEYVKLIENNQQAIADAKDYSIKLSIKVQEIQTKVDEINTKLDGGLTKRRSPFEIIREPEVEEAKGPKEEVKPEVKVETPKEEVINKPNLIKNEKTVVIRTPLQRDIKEEPTDETSKIYDAKIVERILHQARDQKCREEKINILSNWSKLEDRVGHLLSPTAKLLSEGTLTANGYNELLIVYPHASMCNHLMEPKGHTNALQVLKITFGKDYDFIALPENTWQEKRLEYAGQYNMGIKYPRLTPIKNPELKIVVINTTNLVSKKNQVVHQAESFFGEDIVEKEEE